nr:MAG TPA: Insect kinin peptide [Caudoviricetes sp.]
MVIKPINLISPHYRSFNCWGGERDRITFGLQTCSGYSEFYSVEPVIPVFSV